MPVYIYAQFKGLYDCHGHLFRQYISHYVYTVGLSLEPEFYHNLMKIIYRGTQKTVEKEAEILAILYVVYIV